MCSIGRTGSLEKFNVGIALFFIGLGEISGEILERRGRERGEREEREFLCFESGSVAVQSLSVVQAVHCLVCLAPTLIDTVANQSCSWASCLTSCATCCPTCSCPTQPSCTLSSQETRTALLEYTELCPSKLSCFKFSFLSKVTHENNYYVSFSIMHLSHAYSSMSHAYHMPISCILYYTP